LSVSFRVKTEASFLAKVRKKRYKDPKSDCTDLLGIRIITYLEDDVHRAAAILKNSFSVDSSKSVDKRTPIEVDRVGYRSLHFVATLGAQRSALPEYSRFEKNVFEIQIRTVLQHAWAEIEHDRNYKFSSSLPR